MGTKQVNPLRPDRAAQVRTRRKLAGVLLGLFLAMLGDKILHRLTWKLAYRRTFDPGWYFGPLQSYGMEQPAAFLADTFTPQS